MKDDRWWLSSQRVVLGAGDQLRVAPACVEIHGTLIGAVHALGAEGQPAGLTPERHVDYGDKLLAPAFINAHTHLALGFLRGADISQAIVGNMVEEFFFAIERRMTPADVRAFARMGAYESLLAGVGLVWDHYYAAEEIAGALADVGLSGVVAPTLQDLAGPGSAVWQAQLAATESLDTEAWKAQGVYSALGPHATDTVSAQLFERACVMSEQRDLPMHLHLAQSLEEFTRAQQRHGCSPTEWLRRIGVLERTPRALLAHGIYASEADLSLVAEHDHTLVFCPYSQLIFGFPAAVDVWERLGVDWVVATDCASNNDTMNVQQELRFIAGQRSIGASWSAGYRDFLTSGALADAERAWAARCALRGEAEAMATPAALLKRVWSGPGALHPQCRAGVIEAGALANLTVFDLNHPGLWPARDPLAVLAMADAAPALWAMWVAGKRVGRDGALRESIVHSEAYRAAQAEADARCAALVS